MNAQELIDELKSKDILLFLDGADLKWDAPLGIVPEKQVDELIRQHYDEIIEHIGRHPQPLINTSEIVPESGESKIVGDDDAIKNPVIVKRGQGDYPQVYRPCSPYEIYGQEEVKQIIINGFKNKNLPHALLFHGASGTGKTTCARIIGMGVLCEIGPTSEPCGQCGNCKAIINSTGNSNLKEINSADTTGIDAMREIRSRFYYLGFHGDHNVFVFDECHRLSESAQDLLLKEVEDVKDHNYFIFCSTNPDKINEPLKNRCLSVELKLLEDNLIYRLLVDVCKNEGINYSDNILKSIIEEAKGRPRNALVELQKAVLAGRI